MTGVDSRWSSDPAPPGLARALAACDAGAWREAPVLYFEETGSTNDVAARLAAAGAPDGTCVLARAQTAGRGRRGRAWISPPGAGLYFSALIRPPAAAVVPGPLATPPPVMLLTLMAAVASVDALVEVAGFAATIKWPNDLIVERRAGDAGGWDRRKLGGILTEGSVTDGVIRHVVVGIGINLDPAVHPPEVATLATSVRAETGRPVEVFPLFAACRAALARERERLFAGDLAGMIRRWRERAPSAVGARVKVTADGRRLTGVTAGLADDGTLAVVADVTGERLHVVAGDVEWI